MKARAYLLLFVLWAGLSGGSLLSAQSAAGTPEVSHPQSNSYRETVRMLKDWLDTEENDQLIPLFDLGESRSPDLLAACRTEADDVAAVAFLSLQLMDSYDCQPCGDSISSQRGGSAVSCAAELGDTDFARVNDWLAKRRRAKGYDCGGEDRERIDDSLVYLLVLDGSPRAVSLLKRLHAMERACAGDDTIIGEALEGAPSMIQEAKEIGHNLKIDPATLADAIRASTFFLPAAYRKDSDVELLARNREGNRLLLEVSYHCGTLCGRGYFVVLRKDGPVWQYTVIRMAWIS
jgi:hypothetical protein